ncbi:unnamed protein product [Caretta caretta]
MLPMSLFGCGWMGCGVPPDSPTQQGQQPCWLLLPLPAGVPGDAIFILPPKITLPGISNGQRAAAPRRRLGEGGGPEPSPPSAASSRRPETKRNSPARHGNSSEPGLGQLGDSSTGGGAEGR